MEKLTKKQTNILNFIKDFILKNGYPPTIREIADHFKVYIRAAQDHLKALEKKGYIVREKGKTRSICLLPRLQTSSLSQLPVLGQVSAGNPLETVENIEDVFIVSQNLFHGKKLFALKIRGDSMVDAGIYEDDFVVVKVTDDIKDGEIVVALLNGETTIKRFFREKGRIKLQPENPEYKPIFSENIKVIGKVIGLLRKF
ncbi:repressor LexA [Candidatus Dependentiae bacterium]|nr:repressor LexA [Candidatus Dependentiae bacterium]